MAQNVMLSKLALSLPCPVSMLIEIEIEPPEIK